jgi:hypothetical protein
MAGDPNRKFDGIDSWPKSSHRERASRISLITLRDPSREPSCAVQSRCRRLNTLHCSRSSNAESERRPEASTQDQDGEASWRRCAVALGLNRFKADTPEEGDAFGKQTTVFLSRSRSSAPCSSYPTPKNKGAYRAYYPNNDLISAATVVPPKLASVGGFGKLLPQMFRAFSKFCFAVFSAFTASVYFFIASS